ncbi:MAG TPA: thiolase family protein [Anaerolineae bacterium]|nr:thiolase family protein [Caldilineae bacterium]HID34393.1 thiolase family protein [Anaerolineae bacterium]HIQ12763.1 thiolase family protein [Caldilineales bacterium]
MKDAYIVSAARTPTGRRRGMFSDVLPLTLSTIAVKEAAARAGVEPADVDDVILGCVTPMGEQGANIARLTALNARFPVTVPGVTINRMCGSSQQAVHFAAQAIMAGDMDVVVAGGVEHMTRVPMMSDYPQTWPEDFPYQLVHQGISAELIAEKWGLTRMMLDEFGFESHQRAARATREGLFDAEIIPVEVPIDGGSRVVAIDEGIRFDTSLEKMLALKPAFKEDGVITAGNSSQISDGAAALTLMSEAALKRYNREPMARVVARVVVGDDPILMLAGVIPATRKVLARAGLTVDEIDVFEVNEAFASVALAWMTAIQPDPAKVNPRGGAIALGHPLGASGARIMTTLVHELAQMGGRYGLQVMCIGHGMATATIVENLLRK